jgi:uncharacterized protein YndB with AHSA1/START domain
MKKIAFETTIAAPKKTVWEIMLHPATYKEWVNAAWPGSFFRGEWKEGETLRFISEDGSGTLATLIAHKPYDYSFAKHIAVLNPGGIEDRDSDVAQGWVGTTESYTFTEQNGQTELVVELNIHPNCEKMFSDGWPKALAKLKEMCEQ